jgi:ATP-dependent helicase/nuclease subunit A
MTLTDQAARTTIAEDTSRNLFVVAGAGSGKTWSLVERIATLVTRDEARLGSIAAITFTEKAGAELRDRLRARFEKTARDATTPDEFTRAVAALEELDQAAIGTLHSFAQRILQLYPIEAGLPPRLEVLDEVGSSLSLEEQWRTTLADLLDDPDIRPALQRGLLSGKLDHFESLFKALTNDWDLIASHVLCDAPPPLRTPIPRTLLDAAADLDRVRAACASPDALLLNYLDKAAELLPGLADTDDLERYQTLLKAGPMTTILRDDGGYKRVGSGGNWRGLAGGIDEAKAAYDRFRAEAIQACSQATTIVLNHITAWLAQHVLSAADERRRNGELVFHDLLVLARRVLRESAPVADALGRRFTHLLLDEFQDTDPIQIELAVRVAGGRPGTAHRDWKDIGIPAGSLFVVGDPKQSIYRFRRADIALYLEVQDWFEARFGPESIVVLDTNFRSVPGVLNWLNQAFGRLIQAEPARQPRYDPLYPHRESLPESSHPAVTYLGWGKHEFGHHGHANQLRDLEAMDVAGIIARAIDQQWTVHEVDPISGRPSLRSIQRSDIAVLVPARTSLPMLGRALDVAGIPYRAEASSLVYQSEEVAELLLAAQAVADPSDSFALVMTLRSTLFGLGDDDLWRWKRAGGSFSLPGLAHSEEATETLRELPVYPAMEYLRRLSFEAPRMAPADLLDRLVRDRRALELVADAPDAADRWRRLRFVVDQARAWSENAHGGIRGYLGWARRQASETARVYESILPETDLDAVRVLTIHAAKGLEYPMVILSGLTAMPRTPRGVRLLWTREGYAISVTSELQTTNFTEAAPLDEQMGDAERKRLLYVAATRAKDHLVVSLHRADNPGSATAAELLKSVAPDDESLAFRFDASHAAPPDEAGPSQVTPPEESREELHARLALARSRSARPPSQSASGLEGGEPEAVLAVAGEEDEAGRPAGPVLAKAQRDLDTPSYNKGRDATAIGTAVHAVLQSIDLRTGAGLDALTEMQCLAGGILHHRDLVKDLVRRALESEIVRTAVAGEYWRESLLAMTTPDGEIVEGYADLIYRDPDGGLVVVDYKTDAIRSADDLTERSEFYAPQLSAYASIIFEATGIEPTARPLFLDASP